MYISEVDHISDSGIGLAPAAAIELGAAALSVGAALTTGGDFQTTSAPISYIHEGTLPTQTFRKCSRQFMISAFKPLPIPMPVSPTDPRVPAEKFWFALQYEYNGNDLREVRVDPLPDKSSTLYKSKFLITFVPGASSVPRDPVAAVRFSISGSWEVWDIPFNTKVGIRGALNVKADGSASIQVTSEKQWVNHRSMTGACTAISPVAPKVDLPKIPIPQLHQLVVYFSPAGSDRIRETDEDKIVKWFQALPGTTRGKIIAGTLPIILEGHASTTAAKSANRELSRRRAQRVQRILQDIAGSAAQFTVHAFGEYKAGTRDKVEDPKERRVRIFVMDMAYR
jgi:outer membrane protein OmpA-like peptidoglycan-associated protein